MVKAEAQSASAVSRREIDAARRILDAALDCQTIFEGAHALYERVEIALLGFCKNLTSMEEELNVQENVERQEREVRMDGMVRMLSDACV